MQDLIEGRDYQVIDDGMGDLKSYLERTGRNAVRKAIGIADRALSGRKGQAATTAIIMADLTTDKRAFKDVFSRHSEVINRYFEYVDLGAVSDLMGLEDSVVKRTLPILKSTGYLAAGILLGVAGLTIYNRKQRRP